METSQFPVQGCKFRPMLGSHGHWHARDTHTYCRAFSSVVVPTCFYDLGLSRLGFEHPTFRFRGQRSKPLYHRRGFIIYALSLRYVTIYGTTSCKACYCDVRLCRKTKKNAWCKYSPYLITPNGSSKYIS